MAVVFGLRMNVSDFDQIFGTLFSSGQEGYAQMLHINVETIMGGTQKNSKLHLRWRGPLVSIFH